MKKLLLIPLFALMLSGCLKSEEITDNDKKIAELEHSVYELRQFESTVRFILDITECGDVHADSLRLIALDGGRLLEDSPANEFFRNYCKQYKCGLCEYLPKD